ncbi:QOR1_1 [Sanghuangporus vaninii]
MSSPNSADSLVPQKYSDSEVDSSVLKDSNALKKLPLPSPLSDDSLLVKTLYLSNDLVQHLWMQNPGDRHSEERQNTLSVQLEIAFDLFSLSEVTQIGDESDSIKMDDIVEGCTGWADYYVVMKDKVRVRSKVSGIKLSAFLGSLGLSGATAYFALIELLKVKMSDTLIVSGAAAVGNVAVQYAKKILGVKHRRRPRTRLTNNSLIMSVKQCWTRIAVIGFSIVDYADRLAEVERALSGAVVEGKLILDGAETTGLFSGSNTGKLITKLED